MSDDKAFNQQVVECVIQMLSHLSIQGEVQCSTVVEEDRTVASVQIKTSDSALLIGQHGANLAALQYLVQRLMQKREPKSPLVVVDVNDYKARHADELVALAKRSAAEVQRSRRVVALKPMNAADRRVIHATLAGNQAIKTESAGRDPQRRVMIRPASAPSVDDFSADIRL